MISLAQITKGIPATTSAQRNTQRGATGEVSVRDYIAVAMITKAEIDALVASRESGYNEIVTPGKPTPEETIRLSQPFYVPLTAGADGKPQAILELDNFRVLNPAKAEWDTVLIEEYVNKKKLRGFVLTPVKLSNVKNRIIALDQFTNTEQKGVLPPAYSAYIQKFM